MKNSSANEQHENGVYVYYFENGYDAVFDENSYIATIPAYLFDNEEFYTVTPPKQTEFEYSDEWVSITEEEFNNIQFPIYDQKDNIVTFMNHAGTVLIVDTNTMSAKGALYMMGR